MDSVCSTKEAVLAILRLVVLYLFSLVVRAEAQELKKIHVAIPAVTPAVTTFAVAKDKGYYREEGLDVELVVMPSAVGTQALIGGNVKFSTVGGASMPAILRGAPIRFLFASFSRPMFWLFAKPEIRSIAQLKGKKVGISSLGSGPDSILRDLLKKHGLEGGREVVILPVGSGTARFYALQAGSVDAAMLSIPAIFMAQDAGYRELVSFVDQDIVELQGSILAPAQLLESEPALAEKFVRGSLKGFIAFRDNRAATIQILTRFLRLKEDMVEKIYDRFKPGMTPDGTINEALQRKSIEHIVGRVGVKEPPPLDKIFDFSLTRKLNDELRAKGWRP
jgi:ABC-type nitrate/sulfonate/bicarbonate transport system substrate-binding protein